MAEARPDSPVAELFSRNGLTGPHTRIVRANYLPRFTRTVGTYLPRRFHTWELTDEASDDPASLSSAILQGQGISIEIGRRSRPQPFGYKNALADELHFVVAGRAELDTEVGRLAVRSGDFILIPRGITYRWSVVSESLSEVIAVTESELHLKLTRAQGELEDLPVDAPVPHGHRSAPNGEEYKVVVRHGEQFTSYRNAFLSVYDSGWQSS